MKDNKTNTLVICVSIGLLVGTSIGILNNNIEIWIPIGVSCGLILGTII